MYCRLHEHYLEAGPLCFALHNIETGDKYYKQEMGSEMQKMPSSEIECSKIQHQTADEIILLHKKYKCILREKILLLKMYCQVKNVSTAFSW